MRAQSPYVDVREALARDSETPPEILYYLAMDAQEIVRQAVAQNPKTPKVAKFLNESESHRIIAKGDAYEIGKLMENSDAKISEEDMDTIIMHAPNHEEWHEALVKRPSLTLDMIKKIALFVCHALLKVLLERNKIDEETAKELIHEFQKRVNGGALAKVFEDIIKSSCYPETHETARDRAHRDFINGRLTESQMLDVMGADPGYVIEGLAIQAGIDVIVVHKAISMRNARALVAICWKAGFSARMAQQVQQAVGKIPHSKLLYPKHGTEFPMSEQDMLWQLDMFASLGR